MNHAHAGRRRRGARQAGPGFASRGSPDRLAALVTTAFSLWTSWQLEGGAASVNEAGRMLIRSRRLNPPPRHDEPRRAI